MTHSELHSSFEDFIRPVTCLEGLELIQVDSTCIQVKAPITEQALNPYGFCHGGWLFTLCDTVSGLFVHLQGRSSVTLSSNISYLKAGRLGDTVTADVECIHSGRKTVVNEVHLRNQDGQLLSQAAFTMYITADTPRVVRE